MAYSVQILWSNNAQTTLANSISNTSLTCNLASGSGTLFPLPGTGQGFTGTFTDAATGLLHEIVLVTSRTGDTITSMIRAQEGTTALNWSANDLFANLVTQGALSSLVQITALQAQATNYSLDTGVVNAYAIALTPPISSAPGPGVPIRFQVKAGNTNAGASVLNAGWGNAAIVRRDGSALIGGELVASQVVEVFWTGSVFQLLVSAPATAAAISGGTDGNSYVTPAQLASALGSQKLLSGQCVLQYTSSSTITLVPKNGDNVPVAGATYQIPSGGITLSNTNITINGVAGQTPAVNSNYLVAVNASLSLELWSLGTGHSPDSTTGNVGVEIITGHPTKTLVGMVRFDASGNYQDTDGKRFLLSWFNRQRKASKKYFASNANIPSVITTPVEIDASIENNFLVWSGGTPDFRVVGTVLSSANTQYVNTYIAFDGISPELEGWTYENVQNYMAIGFTGFKEGLTEGNHYATLVGSVSVFNNSPTWIGGNALGSPPWVPCAIEISVEG